MSTFFNYTRQRRVKNIVLDILIALVVIVCVFPFIWMLMTSIKTRVQTIDPSVWFFQPTLENYRAIFQKRDMFMYINNSIIVVLFTTLISVALGTFAAYGLARFQFNRKEDIAYWILSLRMLPPMAVVIPFFLLGRFVGLLDTHLLLIIVYLSFNIPFTIWMMRGFIEDIPRELEEAAWVDGCSRFQAIRRIIFPLIAPGVAATSIFCVIQSWNEFSLAFFLTSFNARTIPTTVTFFLSVLGVIWGEMAAVGIVATIPVLIFALIVQKYLVRGLTFGAIKS
ncbi:MAG TPA: ABC transporter permease [Candidatus Atribacteria bacterium]|nr:ABC transporter permease [Candidatus Atribacteria bacterium]